MRIHKFLILLFLCASLTQSVFSQIDAGRLKKIAHEVAPGAREHLIANFYQLNNYHLIWAIYPFRQQQLLTLIESARSLGLDASDYAPGLLKNIHTVSGVQVTSDDSLRMDVRLSDAFLHFCSDVKTGNHPPVFAYNGLRYKPGIESLLQRLSDLVTLDQFSHITRLLEPVDTIYQALMEKLRWFDNVMDDPDFREVKIMSSTVSITNKPLVTKLHQLGVLDPEEGGLTPNELTGRLKQAQGMVDVLQDGQLRRSCLAALNVPLRRRRQELVVAINYVRWLDPIKTAAQVALVNIPSATLYVYNKGVLQLNSKVIVGKRSTPSPTLTSTISEVILYPYWMVPNKIAVKELLPSIRRNIEFLSLGGFQVLSKNGGRIVDPYSINWHALGPGNFPYVIRQSTGCDNSLGLLKFNFYNPFSVYLHDTPSKSLFLLNKRYFSHGCMRVEKPVELGHLILVNHPEAIDTLTQKGCLKNQAPIVVGADKPLQLVVMYSTCWFTPAGQIQFFDDVYGKMPLLFARESGVALALLSVSFF